MKERLEILKEIREDRRKLLERLLGVGTNDIRVGVLINELTYLEREILQLSQAIKNENKELNEMTDKLIDNLKNVVSVLNNTEDCNRTRLLKLELTNLLKYTNSRIDFDIWTPLDEEDRKEWN